MLAQPCAGGSGGFEKTGSMAQGGSSTAILLPNGKVLAPGGEPAGSELYDPATGTWTATGSLGAGRGQYTATLLANGKVLVAGGSQGYYTAASAELYDPASGTWTETGSLHEARYWHTATLLPNGKVLVAGGFRSSFGYGVFPVGTAELYDPTSGAWTATGNLVDYHGSHTATLLADGRVLVAGGDPYGLIAELYDPATGTWTATGNLAHARYNHTATLLPNDMVLVAGGWDLGHGGVTAELYDAASGTWTETRSLASARVFHTATLLPSGKVLVAGGSDHPNIYVASAELYDPASATWTATGNLATTRGFHTATLLPNNKVLVAGGGSTSAELYGPKPTLLNISTRVRVQEGDNAMIGGFIITGTEPKAEIVRGIGPSLGIPGALADPVIEVYGPSGQLLGSNDNWRDAGTRQQIIDSGLAPTNDLEPALWGIIEPGAYTVIVRGKNGESGLGLFEVYDLNSSADSRLANVSTRGVVQTGDNVLIGGFIVGGGTEGWTARVLVRALGPSVPVAGALGDPSLELYDRNGSLVSTNDNWKTRPDGTSQQAEIEATTIPPTNDFESALLQTFPAGNYTAIVRGVNSTTGVGLVEAYHLP